jgi:hypothetical protein
VERTIWLERSWEAAAGPLARPLVASSFPRPDGPPRLPLLFTSGTHLETGRLVITAPVVGAAPEGPAAPEAIARAAVPEAIDAVQALRSDPPFSVAASYSARFPYVTAPGLLRQRGSGAEYGQVVDGGYFDNLGSTAMLAAARALEEAHQALARQAGSRLAGTRLHVFLVQVWSDPDRVQALGPKGPFAAMVPRCGPQPPPGLKLASPSPLDFLLSPFGALISVRGERANAGAAPIVEAYCGTAPAAPAQRHFHIFTMGPAAGGVRAPLNWVLPPHVREAIAAKGLSGFPGMANEANLAALGEAWRAAAAPTAPSGSAPPAPSH